MKLSPLQFLIILCSITLIILVGFTIWIKGIISTGMPSLEQLENPKQNLATQVFSADGKLLDQFYIERRISLKYEEIPRNFIDALITSEDRKFYDHWGVHVNRIIKAVVKRILFGQRSGASTITQQVARNLFLDQSPTLERKIREAAVAMQIERTYSKEEILMLHANTVHFGRGAYGVEVASQMYFGKPSKELNLSESALLVGLLPRPVDNPINNYERSIERRNIVLYQMLENDVISQSEYQKARNHIIEVAPENQNVFKKKRRELGLQSAPHFVEMIRTDFKNYNNLQTYDLYRDGLVIHTTLNSRIQKYLNEAIDEHLNDLQDEFDKKWNWERNKDLLNTLVSEAIRRDIRYRTEESDSGKETIAEQLKKNKTFVDSVKKAATTIQVGVSVIDPLTGSILAMVGASPRFMDESSTSYSLNHATQIKRQPGSAFKPFVYSTSLMNGLTPKDSIECGPFEYKLPSGDVWSPRGTGRCEEGEYVSLYNGLRISINTVSARLITSITSPHEVVGLVRKMGIKTPLFAVPAISLGAGGEVIPLEITSAYGSYVYNGLHVSPFYVKSINDNFGNIVYEQKENSEVYDALPREIAIQMTYMMESVVNAGTARRAVREYLSDDIDAAGKTGTTNDAVDAWFIGFTPQLVAGVWVGFDDNRISFDVLGSEGYGGRAAAPIWGRLMKKIYDDPILNYSRKRFAYKSNADSTNYTGFPYPLTETQKTMQRERNPMLFKNIDPSDVQIKLSEPEIKESPLLRPLPRQN